VEEVERQREVEYKKSNICLLICGLFNCVISSLDDML
jgi:hypothetical protein